MENPREDLMKITKPLISPIFQNYFYFPAGSFYSQMDSFLSDENKSEPQLSPSCQIITYESICYYSSLSKETQTDFQQVTRQDSESLAALESKCEKYKKSRKELKSQVQSMGSQETALKEEVKKLKANLNFHHNMVEKIAALTADISGHQDTPNSSKIDVHIYNFIISKLEIIRSRAKRFKLKISQLESDKSSMSQLISFYTNTGKLLENSKSLSKRPSVLVEKSLNTISNNEDLELQESSKPLSNTTYNLKGISKLSKPPQKKKSGSFSVSPVLCLPKKPSCKENLKPSVKCKK